MSAILTYAKDKNNQLVHIDAVENGGKCNCICPYCEKPLFAKNGGDIREHHFAHYKGNECEHAYETTLHMLAKEIIMEEQCIMLPPSDDKKFPSGLVKLHNLKEEQWDNVYGIRPDIDGIMENGERLIIEFFVSHKVQRKKNDTIVNNNLKCIEIDLNYIRMDKSSIREFLINSNKNRKWVTNTIDSIKGDGFGISYERNPLHEKAIEFIKKKFDEDNLIIMPYIYNNEQFDLKKLGYDTCERNINIYRNFKSDLILYRKEKENKGYISISIRGRRRNSNNEIPKDLRVIDIIIRDEYDYNKLTSHVFLKNDNNKYIFDNFGSINRPNNYKPYNTGNIIQKSSNYINNSIENSTDEDYIRRHEIFKEFMS